MFKATVILARLTEVAMQFQIAIKNPRMIPDTENGMESPPSRFNAWIT